MVIFLLIVIAVGVLLISETGKNILGFSISSLLVLGKFLLYAGVLGLMGYVLYEIGFGIILVLLGLGFWGLILGLLGGKLFGGKKEVVNLEKKEEKTEIVFVPGKPEKE